MKLSIKTTWTIILTLLALTFSAIGVTPAHAVASFTVDSPADAVDAAPGNGVCATAGSVCTLRAAIQEANALADATIITVPAGTYTLTIPGRGEYFAATGDLDITSNITINGVGAGSTIIQAGTLGVGGPPNGIDRVFFVDGAYTVNISGVTIRNGNVSSGNHGGGIANYLGTLTITNSAFSGNSATLAPVGGDGGGISNNGTLIVTNSTFSGNSASYEGGGIFNMGTLTITNSTFSGNSANGGSGVGGGIYNNSGTSTITNSSFASNSATSGGGGIFIGAGVVTITNSTFSANSALSGGGIDNVGTLTITNNTFSGNSASGDGGGIINGGALNITNSTFSGNNANGGSGVHGGGGITNGGTLNITNSTFSGNGASNGAGGGICNWSTGTLTITNSAFSGNNTGGSGGGGGIYNQGTVTITNSTLSGNSTGPAHYGGGIYNFGGTGTVTLLNTIVANSTGPNCLSSGTITADSYNLDTDGTCDNATQKTTAQINLGSLANNGGPTQTFALLTGSSAIDAGDDMVCAAVVGSPTYGAGGLDQRGVVRPQGAHCDIGSYETKAQSGPNFVVNTNIDINDNACENAPGNCSLREAIIAANAAAGDDTITVPAGVYTLTIAGTGEDAAATGDLDITSNITINGAGAGTTIIDGGALDRVFHVTGAFTVNISGVTVRNGNASGADDGGGIFNPVGTLTITNSTFSGNSANGGFGGGIFNNAGDLTITNSTFSGNSAPNGGGIFNLTGTLTITNSTLSGNSAAIDRGGGIFNNAGDLTITNSTFSDNSAANGAIYNGIGTVTLRNTIVANSTSGGNCSGKFTNTNGGNNIDDGTTCGWGSASGSMSSTPPLLGALANNGGSTQTFALLTGSPAIDGVTFNGSNSAPLTDQRGVARPQGQRYDIGAFELVDNTPPDTSINSQNPATTPTNSTSMIFTFSGADTDSGVKSFECYLDGGSFAACLSPRSYAILADGSHTFNVRAIDFDGNVDASPASHTWTVDTSPPTVVSSVRADPNPTSAASVNFTVTFSESVTGVDVSDFSLTKTGVSGATVSGVSGSGSVYTVTVNTAPLVSGVGTIRLDVRAGATVTDLAGNPLAGLPYTSGETYDVRFYRAYIPLVIKY